VESEQPDGGNPGEHRVGAEQVGEVTGIVTVRVERDAPNEVRQRNPPDERRADAPDHVRAEPGRTPAWVVALAPPLERHHAQDQEHEHEQKREIEAREHRPVPGGKRCKGRAGCDDEPDLVPVPDRPDRLEHHMAIPFVPADERQQNPDAEVEALEHEVPDPEEGDYEEPEDLEIHQKPSAGCGSSS
jgi:hypothetical protein